MSAHDFDDPALRSAMREYVAAAELLDSTSSTGAEPRQLLDLAEAKTLASMRLRRRLTDVGWSAPVKLEARS